MDGLDCPAEALELVERYLQNLHNQLCEQIEIIDQTARFVEDPWTRSEGGGGVSRILQHGGVFEKAGINFSHVIGTQLPPSALHHRPELIGSRYHALGLSLVLHPDNPYVPTTHANVRFFIAETASNTTVWWFGGGFDLTPYYGFREDCQHWHRNAKNACLPFGEELYPRFKAWCDDYFFLKHRQEARGIGGLFFDDYAQQSFAHSFGLMQSVGNHFISGYAPIVAKRRTIAYGEREKKFQCLRRGRYVEFNLLYDRGTLFGLQSGGRTESILMSLPPLVHWSYNWAPEPRSPEQLLLSEFLPAQDWLA